MFGLIRKKKLIKNAIKIYRANDTGKKANSDNEFYYNCGNANALNALCSSLGIDLTAVLREAPKGEDA